MKKATVKRNGETVIVNADVTTSFWERFRGLMFAQSIPDNYGLLIRPCNQIHMLNMKFPLDVIYISKDGTVADIDEDIKPWKIGRTVKDSVAVLEVNSGTCARLCITRGDTIEFTEISEER